MPKALHCSPALFNLASGLSIEDIMTDSKKKQKTPKGHEIPVPKKEEFEENLKKAAKSPPSRLKK